METLIMMGLFAAVGASTGSLLTIWAQARSRRRTDPPADPQRVAQLNTLETNTLERVVTALDRFDRRLEAVEQRMEFSEKLLLQPSPRGVSSEP